MDIKRISMKPKNNDNLHEKIEPIRIYPLRINNQTVIWVTKEKCNEAYRQAYMKRMGLVTTRPALHETCDSKVDLTELQKMYSSNVTIKDMARHFDVAKTTIQRYIKANNMTR